MIKKEIVEYVAGLAKIEITKEEESFFSAQLTRIIDYIDKLKRVDTEGVLPMRSLQQVNIFRDDRVKKSLLGKEILENAPSSENGYFKIPKVI